MSARRHLNDATIAANDLVNGLSVCMAYTRVGQHVTHDELAHLLRAARAALTRIAQAQASLPAEFDRRLPHSQMINLDAATQSVEKPGEYLLDILNDAKEM